jgi:hypothetical protein
VEIGLPYKGARRGEGGYPSSSAATYLRRQANVRFPAISHTQRELALQSLVSFDENRPRLTCSLLTARADDKTAAEYNLEGGATLHLVLALRGGCDAM